MAESEVGTWRFTAERLEAERDSLLTAQQSWQEERARLVAEKQNIEEWQDLVVSLVSSYQWLAEGRGPYAYNDGRYDDDVMHFVQQLAEILPPARWEPSTSVFTRLTAERDALRLKYDALEVDLQRTIGMRERLEDKVQELEVLPALLSQQLAKVEWLGEALHLAMDAVNSIQSDMTCRWCNEVGYDSNGLKHKDSCPLQAWRNRNSEAAHG